MQTTRPSDRQLAIFVSVAVGVVVAVITTATFYWVYDLALGRERRELAATIGLPWSPSDGIAVISQAQPNVPEAGDLREPWLGEAAWNEGVQAGQAWVQQFPNTVNVQVLQGMSSAQIWTYMQQYVSGGLGVGCQYCHNINNFASDEIPQKASARAMLRLVNDVNAEFIVGLPNWRGNYVQCTTCHNNQPNNLEGFGVQFANSVPPIQVVVDPLDSEGVPIIDPALKPAEVAQPVDLKDAILFYVYNYQIWKPFDPNVEESGRGSMALTFEGGPTQEQVTINQNVMNYQAWSLGVGCTFCHNSRNFLAFETDPAGNLANPLYAYNRLKAQRMLQLTTWLAENWPAYGAIAKDAIPTIREGGASEYSYRQLGDGQIYNVPGCYTCHQGNSVPLAAINQSQIAPGDAGIVQLPPALRGNP
jgi:photosynthetic reaction center cytochrome c subunit